MTEQARLGTSIYYEECTTPDFVNFKRFLRGLGDIADINFLGDVWQEKTGKGLDVEKLRQSSTVCLVAVTEKESGEGRLLDIKNYPDPVEVLKASTWMPGLCPDAVSIGGEKFVDGSIGYPFPFEKLIADYSLTHLLVIANCPYGNKATLRKSIETTGQLLLCRKYSPELRQAIKTQSDRFDAGVESFRNLIRKGFAGGIIWSDNNVKSFTRNPTILKEVAVRAEQFTLDLIQKHK